jgi:hypothetical protein
MRDHDKSGAEGETRTPTGKPPLDPEPSASTSSATSARENWYCLLEKVNVFLRPFFVKRENQGLFLRMPGVGGSLFFHGSDRWHRQN